MHQDGTEAMTLAAVKCEEQSRIYFLRVVPGSCRETCPVLPHGGNEVIIMRVEDEVDMKEEDIPVAVKFSTAKVKCRCHFDQATQCCCVSIHITLYSTDDSTPLYLATRSSSDYYCSS
jgi:creatinine amidohydrolase/Fe(II)-dependent formamide hydrolase-like protein